MNKVAKKYYRLLRRQFALLERGEKTFLNDFKKYLKVYSQQYPHHQLQDYIAEFGEPEEIISAYYERIDSKYVISHMKSRHIIKHASILIVIIISILAAYFIATHYQMQQYYQNSENIYYQSITIEE